MSEQIKTISGWMCTTQTKQASDDNFLLKLALLFIRKHRNGQMRAEFGALGARKMASCCSSAQPRFASIHKLHRTAFHIADVNINDSSWKSIWSAMKMDGRNFIRLGSNSCCGGEKMLLFERRQVDFSLTNDFYIFPSLFVIPLKLHFVPQFVPHLQY